MTSCGDSATTTVTYRGSGSHTSLTDQIQTGQLLREHDDAIRNGMIELVARAKQAGLPDTALADLKERQYVSTLVPDRMAQRILDDSKKWLESALSNEILEIHSAADGLSVSRPSAAEPKSVIDAAFAFVEAHLIDPLGPDNDGAWDDLCIALSTLDHERYEAMLSAVDGDE